MSFSDRFQWLWIVLFAATAAACAEEVSDFNSTLRAGRTETILSGEVRTVDVLFVVDGSKSMCEEQLRLRESFDAIVELLTGTSADFRLAVVNTDMSDAVGGQGLFRTGPGSTAQNGPGCSHPLVDTGFCAGRTSERWLSSANTNGFRRKEDVAALQADFACRALTGLDGDEVGMGLETMRQALSRPEQRDFFRPGSLLVVIFVSDGNDCSDGTDLSRFGPIHALGADACEWNRNLEDSCTTTEPDNDACVWADRDVIAAQHVELGVQCDADPVTGELCRNKLVPRRGYYDFLVKLVAERNGYGNDEAGLDLAANDVIVGVVTNLDVGRRYPSDITPDRNGCTGSLEFDVVGSQGYRYELFARMFPEEHQVITPICDNTSGEAVNFAWVFEAWAVHGQSRPTVCLQSKPMSCDLDGQVDGACRAGARCCPSGQTCGPDRLLQGVEGFEYSVCSGFEVVVEELTPVPDTSCAKDLDCAALQRCADGECYWVRTLVRDVDYSLDLESQSCASATGSPIEIGLRDDRPSRARLVVSYPTVFSNVDSLWFLE